MSNDKPIHINWQDGILPKVKLLMVKGGTDLPPIYLSYRDTKWFEYSDECGWIEYDLELVCESKCYAVVDW